MAAIGAVSGAANGRAQHPLAGGLAPAWAVEWGEDRYGAFAAFAVDTSAGAAQPGRVQQRLRWIPPGTFEMGSPKREKGRFADEGPQHAVTLTRGYWLGETPVTQGLWVAVMGENPSRFRGEGPEDLERPVEQVSWDDCQRFLARLNARIPGLGARLPSEAEWERACRGGTKTATWVGDLTLRRSEAPELDAIAWYGGNSDDETHPVGRKTANPYGLHDMLGNVWEWCQDVASNAFELRRYSAEPATDPVHAGTGSFRVVRGGAWRSYARLVRAACRGADPRGARVGHLGFRLAGGPSVPR